MKRVVSVGGIDVAKELFLLDDFCDNENKSTILERIDGSPVCFISNNNFKRADLSTKEHGWIHKDTLEALINLANEKKGEIIEIVFHDASQINAIFDYSEGWAIKGEPLFLGSEYFSVEIRMIYG